MSSKQRKEKERREGEGKGEEDGEEEEKEKRKEEVKRSSPCWRTPASSSTTLASPSSLPELEEMEPPSIFFNIKPWRTP
jgi:hypothetical protein